MDSAANAVKRTGAMMTKVEKAFGRTRVQSELDRMKTGDVMDPQTYILMRMVQSGTSSSIPSFPSYAANMQW